jgi:transposase
MQLSSRHRVLFEDETDLLLFPPLQAAWVPRGEGRPVLLRGWNARQVVFGAMQVCTGRRIMMVSPRQRADDFQAFLEVLHRHYRRWLPVLLLDEDPSHTAEESLEAAEDLGIELLFLPRRYPELNAMDQLWRRTKPMISANRQYDTIEEQADRFVYYLLALDRQEALIKAGLRSPDFWLKPYLQLLPTCC